MIPGGIAGKLGNRYEAKWLVRSLVDIIAGKAQSLTFEGVESEYQGFEFALVRGEITEWHQTKVNAPKGNWTINALKQEGVLKAFANRLSTDENAHCYFVSQDNAKDFRTLTEDSLTANSYEQYLSKLPDHLITPFDQLKTEWQQSDEVAFEWLKRSHVELIPNRELDSLIEAYGDLFFYQGGKEIFPILRDFLENHFNKSLTLQIIQGAIKAQGSLQFKDWAFDPTIQQRLAEKTEDYLNTYTPFGAGGEIIQRSQSEVLVNELLKVGGPDLVLLTGCAGSGKSGVVRNAIEHLRQLNIPVLAFRVDHYLSCHTKEELGERLTGRKESPVSTLKGTFPNTISIFIIDQVDAVSEVSGRDGQVKEVLFRLIADAHNFGNVRIVVVCRTFDMDSDPRLKNLKKNNQSTQIDVPLLDWKLEVEPLLKKKAVDVSLLNQPQRQLLCLPVNLSVFLEIDDPQFSFRSRSHLHEKLIEKKQRSIRETWTLIQALTAMGDWMSQRQRLNAPASVLDAYPHAADILASEGLIINSRGQINFFHESFFDHVFARAFVHRDLDLIGLLAQTEQHLFRRTQVRQILEALRQNDVDRYLNELSKVLFSNHIRYHIKTAICQWMSYIDEPSDNELEIISRFNEPGGKFHRFFRSAVFSTHAWFDLLNKNNWIQQQLESANQNCVEEVLWWLSNIAGKRPPEVSLILQSWWGGDPTRAERLISWFGFLRRSEPDYNLLILCEEIINSCPKDLFKDQAGDRLGMLLHTWADKTPDLSGRILCAIFDAWFSLNPEHNPFEKDNFSVIKTYSLSELAKKAPTALLQGLTDLLRRSIDMVVAEGRNGKNWYHFNSRTYSGHHFGFDEVLSIYRSALCTVVQEAPEEGNNYLQKLDPHKHECLMHLHLEAIQLNPAFLGNRLLELVTDKMVFDAGWHGAGWMSFALACRSAFPYLSLADKQAIEEIILSHNPEMALGIKVLKDINKEGETEPFWTKKSIIRDLNRSGYEKWCILETIGEKSLNPATQKRLYELRRKFPKVKIAEPEHMEAHIVGSPIKRAQCEKMSDNQWISAILRYGTEDERKRRSGFIDGGARELARELQEVTKKEPERFSKLSLTIPDTAHSSYLDHILWGLAEAEAPSDEMLIQVLKRVHRHPEKPFGSSIARLVERHPHIASNPEILKIVIWYALNREANEDEASEQQSIERETINIKTLVQRGGILQIRGTGVRGQAWEALSSVLWEVEEAADTIWESFDIALEKENLTSVRCSMMKVLTPFFNKDKERFADAIRRLIVLPQNQLVKTDTFRLSPLITHTGISLFPYIFYWLPELADDLTAELLNNGDETQQLIGAWLIFRESFRNDVYVLKANELATKSVDHRRLLSGVTADAIGWTENKTRAEDLLKAFFLDEDKQVREHAADVFRNVKAEEIEQLRGLAANFIKSPAFSDSGSTVLYMLENATCDVLDLVLDATERLISDMADVNNRQGRQGADLYHLQDLLKREYASSEGSVEARRKILDMIDCLLFHDIQGVESIVSTHDRW